MSAALWNKTDEHSKRFKSTKVTDHDARTSLNTVKAFLVLVVRLLIFLYSKINFFFISAATVMISLSAKTIKSSFSPCVVLTLLVSEIQL